MAFIFDPNYYQCIDGVPITTENVDALLNTDKLRFRMPGGNWVPIRRSGATRSWKDGSFRVPYKYGEFGNVGFGSFLQEDLVCKPMEPREFVRYHPEPMAKQGT